MVRVVEDLMLALAQTFDTFVELVEGDVEVPRVTSSRFKSQSGGTDDAGQANDSFRQVGCKHGTPTGAA